MIIRPATLDDAPAISALVRALTQEFIAPELAEEAAKRLLESMNAVSIRAYIRAGYRYHVAEAEGEIVGLIGVKESRHLYHLFVSRSFQRRGWARQLWETAKAASLADGNPGRFTVHSSLGAVGFYEKLGFVKESEAVHKAGVVYVPMKREGADPPSK
ncbi:MAG: GNAT family N-acetyltransferase [Candidatus Manganitrophaceae bacterium]|nr:MAG: GNAT family N-acetyltransferase [Candidatus Manganitrophaceae bacterium]